MGDRRIRLAALGLLICVGALTGGCPVISDAFNPDFLTSFGIPSGSTSGTVLIAFTNNSQFSAQFVAQAFDTLSEDSVTTAGGPITATVDAGKNRTFAVDCPVAAIVPGDASGGTTSTISVGVLSEAADGTVTTLDLVFAGNPLYSGDDFLCGDVIEMRLLQVGTGEAVEDFLLQVRVLPGR